MAKPIPDLRCLSVRLPWWWFILHGGKDIENRDWPTRFRGTILIHASKWFRKEEVADDLDMCGRICRSQIAPFIDVMRESAGCIVGQADIVDCVKESASPWFFGEYGFVLANPVAFNIPIPCKGELGFFKPPIACWDAIRSQMTSGVRNA